MDTLRRLFSCGPMFGAKSEEEGDASKDEPPPKEAVDDKAISAGLSADTAVAIEAAIEAAGSQVGATEGAQVRASPTMRHATRLCAFPLVRCLAAAAAAERRDAQPVLRHARGGAGREHAHPASRGHHC